MAERGGCIASLACSRISAANSSGTRSKMSSKKSSSFDTQGCKSLVGKVSDVVRDDRICTGDERTRYDVSVVVIGENYRALEALPARDRCVFERFGHAAEAMLDLYC